MHKKTLTLLSVIFLVVMLPLFSYAQQESRTIDDIIKKWQQLKPTFEGDPYEIKPSVKPPYQAGKLKKKYLEDALNYVNFIRWLARLNPVKLDDDYNKCAQYASVLLNKTELSHAPDKPADMPEEFYRIGFKGTSSSNIGSGYYSLIDSIDGYMDDSDSRNIFDVGHRRWILDPFLSSIGFGYAYRKTATYVFDDKRERYRYLQRPYIAWPTEDFFPVSFFSSSMAYSVSLNPLVFDIDYISKNVNKIKIYITRENDKKTWVIDSNDKNPAYGFDFFNYSSISYGELPAIIFRPGMKEEIKENDIFNIKITGLMNNNGEEETIQYSIQFFSLSGGAKLSSAEKPKFKFDNIYMPVGSYKNIEEYIKYANNKKSQVIIKSNNSDIISIENNKTIRAKKQGTATIYLYTSNGKSMYTSACRIYVYKPIENIKIKSSDVYVTYSDKFNVISNLEGKYMLPFELFNAKVENSNILSIDSDGFVQTKNIGSTLVTIESPNNNASVSFTIHVIPKVTLSDQSVILSSSFGSIFDKYLSLKSGETKQINVEVKPQMNPNFLRWEIEDTTIAVLEGNGKIKALSKGRTYLRVYSEDYLISFLIEIVVE